MCDPEPVAVGRAGGAPWRLIAVAVGVVVGMAALSRPVLAAFHVAAVVIQVSVVAGGCLVATGVLAAAAVPTVRLWRWALTHWPERPPRVRVRAVTTASPEATLPPVYQALPTPHQAIEEAKPLTGVIVSGRYLQEARHVERI